MGIDRRSARVGLAAPGPCRSDGLGPAARERAVRGQGHEQRVPRLGARALVRRPALLEAGDEVGDLGPPGVGGARPARFASRRSPDRRGARAPTMRRRCSPRPRPGSPRTCTRRRPARRARGRRSRRGRSAACACCPRRCRRHRRTRRARGRDPARARSRTTLRGAPSSRFIWSKSWIIRSTAVPPDCARSPSQSAQSAGGERRRVETARGRPSSPASTRRASSTYSGQNRSTRPTISIRPLRSAAARIASASSTVSASGFSTKTCLPASKARSATSRWSGVGTQTSTAWTSGSGRTASRSTVGSAPTVAATRAARSALRPQTAFTRTRSPSAA